MTSSTHASTSPAQGIRKRVSLPSLKTLRARRRPQDPTLTVETRQRERLRSRSSVKSPPPPPLPKSTTSFTQRTRGFQSSTQPFSTTHPPTLLISASGLSPSHSGTERGASSPLASACSARSIVASNNTLQVQGAVASGKKRAVSSDQVPKPAFRRPWGATPLTAPKCDIRSRSYSTSPLLAASPPSLPLLQVPSGSSRCSTNPSSSLKYTHALGSWRRDESRDSVEGKSPLLSLRSSGRFLKPRTQTIPGAEVAPVRVAMTPLISSSASSDRWMSVTFNTAHQFLIRPRYASTLNAVLQRKRLTTTTSSSGEDAVDGDAGIEVIANPACTSSTSWRGSRCGTRGGCHASLSGVQARQFEPDVEAHFPDDDHGCGREIKQTGPVVATAKPALLAPALLNHLDFPYLDSFSSDNDFVRSNGLQTCSAADANLKYVNDILSSWPSSDDVTGHGLKCARTGTGLMLVDVDESPMVSYDGRPSSYSGDLSLTRVLEADEEEVMVGKAR
ncbi:unnamed protein product [Jaminaea pallidilutea]